MNIPNWAEAIIGDEGMDAANAGPVRCLVLTDYGHLANEEASEPADLSSPDAFRAQVRRWREAVGVETKPVPDLRAQVEADIAAAREVLSDPSDGPITPFVLIGRACLGVSKNAEYGASIYANALYEELVERGWLTAEAMESTGS